MPKLDAQQRRHVQSRISEFMGTVKTVLTEKHSSPKEVKLTDKQKQRIINSNRAYGLAIKYGAKLKSSLDDAINWDEMVDESDNTSLDTKAYGQEFAKYQKTANQLKDRAMLSHTDTDVVKLMRDIQAFCDQEVG